MSASSREPILKLAKLYFQEQIKETKFIPGETYIPVSGKLLSEDDLCALIESCLDCWLTSGRFAESFEEEFALYVRAKHALLTNSGSSANLLAMTALTSPLLGKRRLVPGDEVITAATGFPTTLNPIFQNGLTPVFIDSTLQTYNANIEQIEKSISSKTKAIIFAHTLGNPFPLDQVKALADKYQLWFIEDCCDALGSIYDGHPVGSYGDIATYSFYPAHHITMGEGGAVTTNRALLKKILLSFRDWGRDCWCNPGCDNTCKKRFGQQFGDLPFGYDHKYVYSHIGYNLKVTDMQAAIGLSQLKKLPNFVQKRRKNFDLLHEELKPLEDHLLLPKATDNSLPSWFGFPITVSEKRHELVQYLEKNKIGTRLLFGGNLTKQPAYKGTFYRIATPLVISDQIMRETFWIGLHPNIQPSMIAYIGATFRAALTELEIKPLKSTLNLYENIMNR